MFNSKIEPWLTELHRAYLAKTQINGIQHYATVFKEVLIVCTFQVTIMEQDQPIFMEVLTGEKKGVIFEKEGETSNTTLSLATVFVAFYY